MAQSLPFDQMARLYDSTRTFHEGCFEAAVDYLVKNFPPSEFETLFEPGIGTGRIAIPLAQRGYRVTGVDISETMLKILAKKLKDLGGDFHVNYEQADVTNLPYNDGYFAIAVAVHLFYFIRDWRRAADEIVRVTSGPVILMHTGTGGEIPLVNKRYKEICAELGCRIKALGSESTKEVANHYEKQGLRVDHQVAVWKWTSKLNPSNVLSYVKSRAYSFTTYADDRVHVEAVIRLEKELLDQYGTLDREVGVPNAIYLTIVRR
jgi:ubiquinone/menaquinone biosynthesis C-methylase UbiE